MEKSVFNDNSDKLCLALGFFDCMHLGHIAIIKKAQTVAKENGWKNAVFTFNSDKEKAYGKQIFTFDERKSLYEKCGVEQIIAYDFNEKIKNTSPEDFLNGLVNKFNVKAFVCGSDYRFGKNAQGDVATLSKFCEENNVSLFVVDDVCFQGQKVSSTRVKELIASGKISQANQLMMNPYFLTGKVIKGRGEGHLFGFPTANVSKSDEKFYPSDGVYGCYVTVNGKRYKAVTNVGSKPTFSDDTYTIEPFLLNFSGDIYGKEIKVEFIKKLRDIQKFDSPELLKETIYNDSKWEE